MLRHDSFRGRQQLGTVPDGILPSRFHSPEVDDSIRFVNRARLARSAVSHEMLTPQAGRKKELCVAT
ncbi:hypothetical protein LK533_15330 [Sphingomonas sp. PL-96]|uniref:hypothetical protein n=1 Tax=Sphingomonas sp. PL-96 TaxID=2887201 RepID=UPI001E460E4B|nr:hypothetical protein [Sphingomonas sp. PL-96]MCC2978036.1 hypothetical protein [Sphingomonas sp. PL-96]